MEATDLKVSPKTPKETGDVVKMLEDLSTALVEAKRDGEVNWMDLPKFAPVLLDARAAIDGGDKIPAEIKALTGEQAVALAQDLVAAAMKLVAAIVTK